MYIIKVVNKMTGKCKINDETLTSAFVCINQIFKEYLFKMVSTVPVDWNTNPLRKTCGILPFTLALQAILNLSITTIPYEKAHSNFLKRLV